MNNSGVFTYGLHPAPQAPRGPTSILTVPVYAHTQQQYQQYIYPTNHRYEGAQPQREPTLNPEMSVRAHQQQAYQHSYCEACPRPGQSTCHTLIIIITTNPLPKHYTMPAVPSTHLVLTDPSKNGPSRVSSVLFGLPYSRCKPDALASALSYDMIPIKPPTV